MVSRRAAAVTMTGVATVSMTTGRERKRQNKSQVVALLLPSCVEGTHKIELNIYYFTRDI